MAQRKRHQPWRACRGHQPIPVCHDAVHEELKGENAEPECKSTLVAEKERKRIQSRVQATSPYPPTPPDEAAMVRNLPGIEGHFWKGLPQDIVDNVLRYLPVSRLWPTVMAINPTRWKQIILSNPNILEHGNHVDSSIGFIKTYIDYHDYAAGILSKEPPSPRAFEHTSEAWQSLPRFPEPNVHLGSAVCLRVQSVSKGLILMSLLDVDKHSKMVTWNPVLQSHRWLPKSSLCYKQDLLRCVEVLVVDREEKGYKVIEFAKSWVDRHAISSYTVYDSHSGTWGAVQPPPKHIRLSRVTEESIISCEGCVCLAIDIQWGFWNLPRIVYYDPSLNRWEQVLFPPKFLDEVLGLLHYGDYLKQLLYASGKIYLIFVNNSWDYYTFFITSIALANVSSGVAAFEHLGVLTVVYKSLLVSNFSNDHGPPTISPTRPDELILQADCGHPEHWWYMLPVGRTWYLCVVVCGKWHKRFDLDSRVWTDTVIEVPSDHEHDQAIERTTHSEAKMYHPYIPSWIKA